MVVDTDVVQTSNEGRQKDELEQAAKLAIKLTACCILHLSRHKTLFECWFNVGPAS